MIFNTFLFSSFNIWRFFFHLYCLADNVFFFKVVCTTTTPCLTMRLNAVWRQHCVFIKFGALLIYAQTAVDFFFSSLSPSRKQISSIQKFCWQKSTQGQLIQIAPIKGIFFLLIIGVVWFMIHLPSLFFVMFFLPLLSCQIFFLAFHFIKNKVNIVLYFKESSSPGCTFLLLTQSAEGRGL